MLPFLLPRYRTQFAVARFKLIVLPHAICFSKLRPPRAHPFYYFEAVDLVMIIGSRLAAMETGQVSFGGIYYYDLCEYVDCLFPEFNPSARQTRKRTYYPRHREVACTVRDRIWRVMEDSGGWGGGTTLRQ